MKRFKEPSYRARIDTVRAFLILADASACQSSPPMSPLEISIARRRSCVPRIFPDRDAQQRGSLKVTRKPPTVLQTRTLRVISVAGAHGIAAPRRVAATPRRV